MTRTKTGEYPALLALLLAGTALGACGEPFDPPSLIEKPRVLGATVEVVGDPTRATPLPGESVTVSWIMAAPDAMPELAWAFAICRSVGTTPAEACAPAPLALAQGTGVPSFVVTVPTADLLGNASRLTLYGQICQDGAPVVDSQTNLPGCPGAGTFATLDIYLQTTDHANHNPNLADRPFAFDGAMWLADDPTLDCTQLPHVAVASKGHVISLGTLAEDRETVVFPPSDPTGAPAMTREILQISNFATAGELGQSYIFVEASDPRDEVDVEVTWDAPADMPAGGRVRFTFVARDLRGGVGAVTRTLCVE
jgi:hypothetical protein